MSTEDSSTKQKPTTTIVFTNKHGKFIHVGIPSILAILIVAVAVLVISNHVEKSKSTGNCVHDTKSTACQELKAAIPLLSATKVKQLSPIVTKIQTLKNYQKDTNLEYVLLTYSINMSDPNSASKNYASLVADYKPKVGYDSLLGKNALLPGEFKTAVDGLQQLKLHPNFHIYGMPQ